MLKITAAVLDAIPVDAKTWTEDRPVIDEKTLEVTGTTQVQVLSDRVYIVERAGQQQFVQSRQALPCIPWTPPESDDQVVGRCWKVNPDNDGEVRDGPRDVTKAQWDAWVKAGAISDVDDVKEAGDVLPIEITELPR